MRRANRNRVVVVGGGQAGGRLTQILGDYPHDFHVTLVCQEPHPPYERPPLTKGILTGKTTLEHCLIWRKQDDAWRNVDLRLGVSAVAIDRDARSVQISDGAKLDYDVLVLATGSSVRRFSVVGAELRGVHYLRNIDDSLAIAERFRRQRTPRGRGRRIHRPRDRRLGARARHRYDADRSIRPFPCPGRSANDRRSTGQAPPIRGRAHAHGCNDRAVSVEFLAVSCARLSSQPARFCLAT